MKKKKMKINMSKLSIGGMEKALVDLINHSGILNNYDITLMLVYNNENNYIQMLPQNITLDIIHKGRWNLFGKIFAIIGLTIRYLQSFIKKYDVSICYSHHHGILSKITRKESNNNIIFIHTDLVKSRNKIDLNILCQKLKFDKFKKVICVSECAKQSFIKIYPHFNGKIYVVNNYIDGKLILNNSKIKISDFKKEDTITFINVARHDDSHKKISRILKASYRLRTEKFKFRVLLIGTGKDTLKYKKMIDDMKLDNVHLLGSRINPYPYFKISDAFLFTSKYEGYGIVLNEARILNIPIVSTNVADSKIILEEGYGILCKNSEKGVFDGMKEFLIKGYKIKKKFDYIKYNDAISKKLIKAIEEKYT